MSFLLCLAVLEMFSLLCLLWIQRQCNTSLRRIQQYYFCASVIVKLELMLKLWKTIKLNEIVLNSCQLVEQFILIEYGFHNKMVLSKTCFIIRLSKIHTGKFTIYEVLIDDPWYMYTSILPLASVVVLILMHYTYYISNWNTVVRQ